MDQMHAADTCDFQIVNLMAWFRGSALLPLAWLLLIAAEHTDSWLSLAKLAYQTSCHPIVAVQGLRPNFVP